MLRYSLVGLGRRQARSIVLVVCSFIGGRAQAQNLLEAYHLALAHDSVVASAIATYKAGSESVPQARAALGPSVQASFGVYALRTDATGSTPAYGTSLQASLIATQPLYRPGDRVLLNQAQARMPGLEAQRLAASEDLILRVSQAYLNALLVQETLASTEKQKEALASQLAQAKRTFDIGTGTVTDVADAQSRFDLIAAYEIQARGNLQLAKETLEVLTGVPVDHLDPVTTSVVSKGLVEGDEHSWAAAADTQSPVVQQAAATAQAQRLGIEHAKAAWLPQIDLVGSLSDQHFTQPSLDLAGTGGRSAQIGVVVTIPIWEAGLRDSLLRLAIAQAEQATQDLLTSKRQAALAARQAYTNLQSNAAQVSALEQAVASSQVSLDASLRGNEVGTRTVVDVLNARQQVFQARNQLVAARYSAVLSLLQLKASAAMLSEIDLAGLSGTSATP